jgi:rod shape-determining protein MreD
MNELIKNIIRFILLILLQVFVLNHILLHEFVTPSLYLLFILLLPINMPRWSVMICALLLGFCMDIFMNTQGMHAAACVLIAFLRPFIINVLAPKGFETARVTPSVITMGWIPFLTYAAILVFLHHIVFFTLEVFDFHYIFYLAAKILLSTVVSVGLILLFEMLFASSKAVK